MPWWWYENDALMPDGGMGMKPYNASFSILWALIKASWFYTGSD